MSTFNKINQKVGNYRWAICGLLFFATTINYLDRAVIGLLKENLTQQFNWSEDDYGNIVICFQLAYAISLLLAGRVVDKLGTKMGYSISLIVWSLAAMLHGFARGTGGFAAARALLGVGEAGNFPAANKTVAEWFPQKERALATGLYNSGATIGAIVAPLLVPWIAIHWGWQWAFVITGAVGFIWLIFWALFYHQPAKSKYLGEAEFNYINSDQAVQVDRNAVVVKEKVTWKQVLSLRQTWAFFFGKFFTDPVWWFFLFWLPAFLKAQYGLEGMQVSLPLIVVYVLSSFGSVFGGWLPKRLMESGSSPGYARKMSMLLYALIPLLVLFAQGAGEFNMWYAILIIGLACAAHCAFAANIFATVSDMFPTKAVATVTGIGGMAGALGGILIAKTAGLLFDYYKTQGDVTIGYGVMFVVCALSYVIAWSLMQILAPNFKKVENM